MEKPLQETLDHNQARKIAVQNKPCWHIQDEPTLHELFLFEQQNGHTIAFADPPSLPPGHFPSLGLEYREILTPDGEIRHSKSKPFKPQIEPQKLCSLATVPRKIWVYLPGLIKSSPEEISPPSVSQ
ncbi:MAG: hypothetical protein ACON4R_01920 [Akkermansiaceae bacterium]